MITAEFTAGGDTCKIFRSEQERITRFDLDSVEYPISIYVPFCLNAPKIGVRIGEAISDLVAELNKDFPTGVKA